MCHFSSQKTTFLENSHIWLLKCSNNSKFRGKILYSSFYVVVPLFIALIFRAHVQSPCLCFVHLDLQILAILYMYLIMANSLILTMLVQELSQDSELQNLQLQIYEKWISSAPNCSITFDYIWYSDYQLSLLLFTSLLSLDGLISVVFRSELESSSFHIHEFVAFECSWFTTVLKG